MGATESVIVNASADNVWKVLLNIESYANIFPECQRITSLNPNKSLNPAQPGASYAITMVVHGQTVDMVISVTGVDDQPTKKTMLVATNLWENTSTCRYTVERLEDDSCCRLSSSFALVPNNWYGRLYTWMYRRRIYKGCCYLMRSDLRNVQADVEKSTLCENGSLTELSSISNSLTAG